MYQEAWYQATFARAHSLSWFARRQVPCAPWSYLGGFANLSPITAIDLYCVGEPRGFQFWAEFWFLWSPLGLRSRRPGAGCADPSCVGWAINDLLSWVRFVVGLRGPELDGAQGLTHRFPCESFRRLSRFSLFSKISYQLGFAADLDVSFRGHRPTSAVSRLLNCPCSSGPSGRRGGVAVCLALMLLCARSGRSSSATFVTVWCDVHSSWGSFYWFFA